MTAPVDHIEAVPRHVRATLGGVTVLDTRSASRAVPVELNHGSIVESKTDPTSTRPRVAPSMRAC